MRGRGWRALRYHAGAGSATARSSGPQCDESEHPIPRAHLNVHTRRLAVKTTRSSSCSGKTSKSTGNHVDEAKSHIHRERRHQPLVDRARELATEECERNQSPVDWSCGKTMWCEDYWAGVPNTVFQSYSCTDNDADVIYSLVLATGYNAIEDMEVVHCGRFQHDMADALQRAPPNRVSVFEVRPAGRDAAAADLTVESRPWDTVSSRKAIMSR